MSSEVINGGQTVTKADVEAEGDQGLLNLLINDTVFYVGGYPRTFIVSTWRTVCSCLMWGGHPPVVKPFSSSVPWDHGCGLFEHHLYILNL